MNLDESTKLLIKDLVYKFKDIEWCGSLRKDNSLQTTKYTIHKTIIHKGYSVEYVDKQGEIKTRGACVSLPETGEGFEDKVVWHTHGFNHNSYPSMEDIMRVIANDEIQLSYIFTRWGIWKIYYPYTITQSITPQGEDNYSVMVKFIEAYLNELYYSTYGRSGRSKRISDYSSEYESSINVFIKRIENLFNGYISIDFIEYF